MTFAMHTIAAQANALREALLASDRVRKRIQISLLQISKVPVRWAQNLSSKAQ